MDEKQLNELLYQLSQCEIPSVNEQLEEKVWHEIQRRKKPDSFLGWIFELPSMPYTAFASLILAGLIGFSFGVFNSAVPSAVRARGALELQVFSSSAPNLPSTLLESNL